MHWFEFLRIKPPDIDAGPAEEMELAIELSEISTAFVVDVSFFNEPGFKTQLNNADTEFNVFAHPRDKVAAGLLEHFSGNAHVETAGMKSTHAPFAAPDASRRKQGSHGVADGFLYGSKVGVGTVGTTVGVEVMVLKVFFYCGKIVRWNQTIRVEYHQVVASGQLETVIARKTLSAVILEIIPDIQPIGKAPHDAFARLLRTVLYHQYFKMVISLPGKAFQQFPYFVGPVVNGNNYGVFTHLYLSKMRESNLGNKVTD